MQSIDELAYSSPFKDWSPLGKFTLALSLLVSSLVASSIVIPLVAFCIGFVLLFISTRFRFPKVIVFALLEGMIIFLIGSVVIALVTEGDPLWTYDIGPWELTFSNQGVHLGTMVFLRAVAGATVMLFFATSTPVPQFAQSLRQVRIPNELVELTVLIYRYSFLLLEQLNTMYIAADSRLGFRTYKRKYRTTAKIAVGVFTRSIDMAERSQVALEVRSFRGEFRSYHPPVKISTKWIALSLIVFLSLYTFNLAIVDPAPLIQLLKM
ncbi:MAG: cobalt ECF transporter T component CbiQ [Methanomassiliicoccus sp.]|nr:cobalt ECF transporter T component CbiQ [Methanomassiliicoccus sp.]